MECLVAVESVNLWLVAGWLMMIGLLIYLWRSGGLTPLLRQPGLQHRFLASTLFLLVLWHIRYEIDFGPAFHFLGVTFVTLMLRGSLAVVSGFLAMVVLALLGKTSLWLLPLNLLLTVCLPVLLTLVCVYLEEKSGIRTFFGYIFINAFFGAALTIAGSFSLGLFSCWVIGEEGWSEDHRVLLTYLPLIMMPEGVINGMLVTGVMVYFPHWLATFNPQRYR